MYSLKKIKQLERGSNATLGTMKKLVAQLHDKLEIYDLDESHTQAWKQESIQKDMADARPGIERLYEAVKEIAEELQTQKEFWESLPLVLSLQRFVGNDAPTDLEKSQDVAIRLSVNTELSCLPEAAIKLHFKSAIEDKNWPMIYQAYLAGQRKDIVLDLQEIDIPNQLEGLLSIEQAQINASEAEFLMRDAAGTRLAPETRLTYLNTKEEIELRIKNIKNRIKVNPAATEKAA
ncbi:MAG: hypothetical protein PVG39_26340 [Desulfobacteraceae bacterium]|jgi:hypothetical protein